MKLQYLGADPEVFLKCKTSGKYISGYGFLPGTKKEPFKIKDGAVQKDGMAAEFNIDPAGTADEFITRTMSVMSQLQDMVKDYAEISIESCVDFDDDIWEQTPEEAKILGCDPDFNAYTGKPNPKPEPKTNFRTAAGHIHLGWTDGVDPHNPHHFEACRILTRELDLHLGLPLAFLDTSEGSIKRKLLYGKPGAFRPKPYGLEYRVPSNYWLKDPIRMRWIWTVCHTVFNRLREGVAIQKSQLGTIDWWGESEKPLVNQEMVTKIVISDLNVFAYHFPKDTITALIPKSKVEKAGKPGLIYQKAHEEFKNVFNWDNGRADVVDMGVLEQRAGQAQREGRA